MIHFSVELWLNTSHFNAWCSLNVLTYLSKPAAESSEIYFIMYDFLVDTRRVRVKNGMIAMYQFEMRF